MQEPIVRGIGTYDEEYLFHRATGLGKDTIAERRGQEPSAVLMGPEGRDAEFHGGSLERALSYPMAEGQPKPEERTLQVLRFAEENNSAAFPLFCILVSVVLFSNLNSCCSKSGNKSASDCYHY